MLSIVISVCQAFLKMMAVCRQTTIRAITKPIINRSVPGAGLGTSKGVPGGALEVQACQLQQLMPGTGFPLAISVIRLASYQKAVFQASLNHLCL